jgi:hypothetical protein
VLNWTLGTKYRSIIRDSLEKKQIDTVRPFYDNASGGGTDLETYKRAFGASNDTERLKENSYALHGRFDMTLMPCQFHIVEIQPWTELMGRPRYLEEQEMTQTFEITRWEDRKPGQNIVYL